MSKAVVVILLIAGIFVAMNRHRLYVRDPLAKVQRDGVEQPDARVMIDYDNDVLLDDLTGGHHRVYLVQHWNMTPAQPVELNCLNAIACLADADHPTTLAIPSGPRGKRAPFAGVTMTDRHAEFLDENGDVVSVSLR